MIGDLIRLPEGDRSRQRRVIPSFLQRGISFQSQRPPPVAEMPRSSARHEVPSASYSRWYSSRSRTNTVAAAGGIPSPVSGGAIPERAVWRIRSST